MNPLIAQVSTRIYGWDLAVFRHIHSATPPSSAMLHLARALAEGPLLITAGLLGLMMVRPGWGMRGKALKVSAAAVAALVLNAGIGLVWDRARPFVTGAGHAWMSHAATGSFPSDHLTVQWVVAGTLMLDRRSRRWGVLIALMGLPMAWARVYLGIHYPSDMLGAVIVALLLTLFVDAWFPRHAQADLSGHGAERQAKPTNAPRQESSDTVSARTH
ncbi:phosphatase PAP2 family protein [Rhodanobacter thiooxydans]|uniref:phosphatase PAP2 family protein n=1 Tax=Rhodanobacter thiooxydans TaxID=416169 RepID=UPI0009EE1604|nr:phosphatase PAP2 family protein [Rhodanobacter thiooxydans]